MIFAYLLSTCIYEHANTGRHGWFHLMILSLSSFLVPYGFPTQVYYQNSLIYAFINSKPGPYAMQYGHYIQSSPPSRHRPGSWCFQRRLVELYLAPSPRPRLANAVQISPSIVAASQVLISIENGIPSLDEVGVAGLPVAHCQREIYLSSFCRCLRKLTAPTRQ